MSRLIFNGNTHQVSLIDDNGGTVGTWTAYNNVDSHATLNHVNNGTYNIQDRTTPHQHRADANGPYGSHGIVRFNVAGHSGTGGHSGRANARHQPGPPHATMRFLCFTFLLALALGATAQARTCTPKDAEAADAAVDHLDNWAAIDNNLRKFGHCDDGSIAEGNSEGVARLLIDKWQTLPQLADLIRCHRPLKAYGQRR